jgi:hypothetical protein
MGRHARHFLQFHQQLSDGLSDARFTFATITIKSAKNNYEFSKKSKPEHINGRQIKRLGREKIAIVRTALKHRYKSSQSDSLSSIAALEAAQLTQT